MKDIISLNLASRFSSLFTRNPVFASFSLFVKQSHTINYVTGDFDIFGYDVLLRSNNVLYEF